MVSVARPCAVMSRSAGRQVESQHSMTHCGVNATRPASSQFMTELLSDVKLAAPQSDIHVVMASPF